MNGSLAVSYTDSTNYASSWSNLIVFGYNNGSAYTAYSTGYVDGVRISKTNLYSGSTYTVPTMPYTADSNTILINYFEGTNGSGTIPANS